MESAINLQSVYVTDLVGVAILVIIYLTKGWKLPTRKDESTIMMALIGASVLNCIVDLFVFTCDGKQGAEYYFILMSGNTYLYFYNMIIGVGIIYMIIKHIDHKTTGLHMFFFWMLSIIEAGLLIVNFFQPIVFEIDDRNTYHRGPLYLAFVIIGFVLILYGYAYYLISKLRNPSLRNFPVIQFLLPILIGNLVQMKFYGISLLPVSFAVAFSAIAISLQNECIYVDKLTGVYNRYELDKIIRERRIRRKGNIAALMLDLNDFKSINDNYSHEEGDNALIAFANILVEVVGAEGVVVRFAGDEFIIIMPKFKGNDLSGFKKRITEKVDEYNANSGKPYKLSTAIGCKIFDPTGADVDHLVAQIDALMYKDKDAFYGEGGHKR